MYFLWFDFDCKNQCQKFLIEKISITLLHMLRMYMKIKILRAVQKIECKNSRLGKKVRKEFHRNIDKTLASTHSQNIWPDMRGMGCCG